MRNIFAVKEKFRLALYLTIIFTVCLLGSYAIQLNVSRADESLGSLYKDRIIPARDIFEVQNHLYQNQLLIQDLLVSLPGEEADLFYRQMAGNNLILDSLIRNFEQTLLVRHESQALKDYQQQLTVYRKNYQSILARYQQGDVEGAGQLFHQQEQASFRKLIETVEKLALLQASVGQQVYHDSHQKLLGAEFLSYLVLGVTLVLGLFTQKLLQTASHSVRLPYKPFLN